MLQSKIATYPLLCLAQTSTHVAECAQFPTALASVPGLSSFVSQHVAYIMLRNAHKIVNTSACMLPELNAGVSCLSCLNICSNRLHVASSICFFKGALLAAEQMSGAKALSTPVHCCIGVVMWPIDNSHQ